MPQPVVVTGQVKTPDDLPLPVGSGVTVTLSQGGFTATGEVVGKAPVQASLDASGNYSVSLYKNSDISPANTYYNVNEAGINLFKAIITGAGQMKDMVVLGPPAAIIGVTGNVEKAAFLQAILDRCLTPNVMVASGALPNEWIAPGAAYRPPVVGPPPSGVPLGGVFGQFGWDSAFASEVAANRGWGLRAQSWLKNWPATQQPSGMYPQYIRPDAAHQTAFSQAPLIAWATLRVYQKTLDQSFLTAMYASLKSNYAWWETRDDGSASYGQLSGLASWGCTIAQGSVDAADNAAKLEMGQDLLGVWHDPDRLYGAVDTNPGKLDYCSPDLNALLVNEANSIALIADVIAPGEAATYRTKRDNRAATMRNLQFDDEQRLFQPVLRHDLAAVINQLTLNQSTFEVDALGTTPPTGWALTGCTAPVDNSITVGGSAVRTMKMTSTAGGSIYANTSTGAAAIPVIPGQTITARAYLQSVATARGVILHVYWYKDAAGNPSTVRPSDNYGPGSSVVGQMEPYEQIAIVPSDANFAVIQIEVTGTAAAEVHHVWRISWTLGSGSANEGAPFSAGGSPRGGTTSGVSALGAQTVTIAAPGLRSMIPPGQKIVFQNGVTAQVGLAGQKIGDTVLSLLQPLSAAVPNATAFLLRAFSYPKCLSNLMWPLFANVPTTAQAQAIVNEHLLKVFDGTEAEVYSVDPGADHRKHRFIKYRYAEMRGPLPGFASYPFSIPYTTPHSGLGPDGIWFGGDGQARTLPLSKAALGSALRHHGMSDGPNFAIASQYPYFALKRSQEASSPGGPNSIDLVYDGPTGNAASRPRARMQTGDLLSNDTTGAYTAVLPYTIDQRVAGGAPGVTTTETISESAPYGTFPYAVWVIQDVGNTSPVFVRRVAVRTYPKGFVYLSPYGLLLSPRTSDLSIARPETDGVNLGGGNGNQPDYTNGVHQLWGPEYLAILGLLNYGMNAVAADIAARVIQRIYGEWKRTGQMHEYCGMKGTGRGSLDYAATGLVGNLVDLFGMPVV